MQYSRRKIFVEIELKIISELDAFADVTKDHNFIHVDPERAAETPFGGTIAHGFLTLSMLSVFAYQALARLEEETRKKLYYPAPFRRPSV